MLHQAPGVRPVLQNMVHNAPPAMLHPAQTGQVVVMENLLITQEIAVFAQIALAQPVLHARQKDAQAVMITNTKWHRMGIAGK